MKELTAKILQYTGRQTPPAPDNEPFNNGARYRPILSTTTVHEDADRSVSHQEANHPLPVRQRPIPQPLELHKHSSFKYYGSEMSGSPNYADSNMSSPSASQESVRYNRNMEISPPNRGNYYSTSMYSPRSPSYFAPSNPNPYSLIPSNYSSSNYTPSTLALSPSSFTPSPSPWSSQLNTNSPRFKFPSSGNIALACSPFVSSPAMFDDNLSPISPNQTDQVFFPSNSQGSDSRPYSARFPNEGFASFDQRPVISDVGSRPTFDFDRILATDSLYSYSYAGPLSSGAASGYSGNVPKLPSSSQEVDTFGVKGLLKKANDNAESMMFDQNVLPSQDCKDGDMLLNFMKGNSGTFSEEEYNIWGFNSNTSPGENAK